MKTEEEQTKEKAAEKVSAAIMPQTGVLGSSLASGTD